MADNPLIVVVDDESAVLAAIARDLQPRYGDRFRVLRANSGAVALDTLKQLTLRNAAVALLLVDQRMPVMTGIEFLERAIELYPNVKRVLLTAYADTEAAITAINDIQLDHYLMKPWDPPDERLYPIIDDVLDEWLATYHPPFEGIRIIGNRWSSTTYELKDFLARNLIPYQWLDIEQNEEATKVLEQIDSAGTKLPVVILPDGKVMSSPSQAEMVSELNLGSDANLPVYDLAIVGAGPSGLAGAVYGASEGLRTLVIERQAPGGQAGTSSRIENYLGFPAGLSGSDLARRGVAQARRLGAEILVDEAVEIEIEGNHRILKLASGNRITCQAVLLAPGVSYRTLDVPGIERLHGAGVYYGGALSEAISTTGEDVYIVGGANSAGQAAIHFAKYARSVTLVVRGNELPKSGMSQYLIDQIMATENIRICFSSNVIEALGEHHLEALNIEDSQSANVQRVRADGLFIFIGAKPYTDWMSNLIGVDGAGYVLTGSDSKKARNDAPRWSLRRQQMLLETNIPGIFAAGDIRHHSMKRIASATGEGAMAIHFIHQYLGML